MKHYRKGIERILPFPPDIIRGFSKVEAVFTSGDLMRAATGLRDIDGSHRSVAKFNIRRMVELDIIERVPKRSLHQKRYPTISQWIEQVLLKKAREFEVSHVFP